MKYNYPMVKLINLPQPNSLDDRLDPPLGLMYIGALLKKNNISCEIIALPFVEKRDWKNKIGKADLYGITVFSACLYLAKEVAKIAKENNPKGKVIVGGPHPTTLTNDILTDEPDFDIAVKGEGEITMLELAQGIPLHDITGIVYRDGGRIVKNIVRPLVENLDILPFPDREILKVNTYTRKIVGNSCTSILTMRGCPFSCAFCCKDVFGYKVRFRSIENVIGEIKQIKDTYGIRHFLFYDDTFVLHRQRTRLLCEELSKLDIIFRCNGDARHDTYEDYKILYRAGCREISFGIESGSQKILDILKKGVTVEQNKRAITYAKKAGLIIKTYLMIGSPGETEETVLQTMKFIEEADPDQFTLFTFVPLPGCDVWKHPQKYGIKILNKDFRQYFNIAGQNEGGIVIETEELGVEDIRRLREKLVRFLKSKGQRGKLQDYYSKIK